MEASLVACQILCILLLVFKALHEMAPGYICELLQLKSQERYYLCLDRHPLLKFSLNKMQTLGDRAFVLNYIKLPWTHSSKLDQLVDKFFRDYEILPFHIVNQSLNTIVTNITPADINRLQPTAPCCDMQQNRLTNQLTTTASTEA